MIWYVLAWLPMLVIAIANGAFRQLIFAKVMPEVHAHQLSTVTGSVLIGVFIWFVIGTWPPSSAGQAPLIGVIWLVLTVGFEAACGHSRVQIGVPVEIVGKVILRNPNLKITEIPRKSDRHGSDPMDRQPLHANQGKVRPGKPHPDS